MHVQPGSRNILESGKISIKTAKNILDLDKKFQMGYGQQSLMAVTARSQSLTINDRVDTKILNIMKKL